MSEFVLSHEAELDLVEIWGYVYEQSCSQRRANTTLRDLYAQFARLAQFPKVGTLHPELGDDVFLFPGSRWYVLYRPAAKGIEIIRVTGADTDLKPMA